MNELSIDITYIAKDENVAIVSFDNVLDIANLHYIKDFIADLVKKDRNNIVLDFSKVEYVEKSVWDFFIDARKKLYIDGGDIIIANMYGFVKNDYALMELSSLIPSYPNFEEALYSFGILFDIKYA